MVEQGLLSADCKYGKNSNLTNLIMEVSTVSRFRTVVWLERCLEMNGYLEEICFFPVNQFKEILSSMKLPQLCWVLLGQSHCNVILNLKKNTNKLGNNVEMQYERLSKEFYSCFWTKLTLTMPLMTYIGIVLSKITSLIRKIKNISICRITTSP